MVEFSIDTKKMALLVIDMQNAFVSEGHAFCAPEGLNLVQRLTPLITRCRGYGIPVIYTAHVIRRDHSNLGVLGRIHPATKEGALEKDSDSAAIHPALSPQPGDILIEKPRYGAFYSTDLELILRQKGVETVVISGISTNVCCETTAREAVMRDFQVIFLSDGTECRDLPDIGYGPVPHEELQRVTLTSLGRSFAQIMTIEQVMGLMD